MLSGLDEPASKSAIMNRAQISYTQLKRYHKFLLEKELIREHEGRSVLTEKGKAFLNASLAANQILGDNLNE